MLSSLRSFLSSSIVASLELSHGVLGWCDGIIEAELDSLDAPRAPPHLTSGLPVGYWPEGGQHHLFRHTWSQEW